MALKLLDRIFSQKINFLCIYFQNILNALRSVTKGRTTIVIAHRLSTVVDADEILVLERGRVAERGNHYELMAKPGSLYKELWEKQSVAHLENDNDIAEEIKS